MPKRVDLPLWLWRYPRDAKRSVADYIHFMARPEACDEIIQTLRGLAAARITAHRTLPARQLRVEHDPTGFRYSFSWFAKLRLEVVIDDPELRQMHLSSEGDTVLLAVTPPFVPELIETVESVKAGGDDFGFGPDTRRKAPLGAGSRDRESLHLCCWQPMRGTE